MEWSRGSGEDRDWAAKEDAMVLARHAIEFREEEGGGCGRGREEGVKRKETKTIDFASMAEINTDFFLFILIFLN